MKATLTTAEHGALAKELQGEYELKSDKYVLKVEGELPGFVEASKLAEANGKLAEFRDNNRGLNAKVTELEARLKELGDPEEVKKLRGELDELRKKAPAKDTELKAIKDQLDALGKALSEAGEREKSSKLELARKDLQYRLTQAGLKAGVNEQALVDFLARGASVFTWEDGKLVAKQGATPLFSKQRPSEPLGIDEWVAEQATAAPHLFKPSGGSGAPGQSGQGGGGGVRSIPANARLTAQDITDIAAGKAVRESAPAA